MRVFICTLAWNLHLTALSPWSSTDIRPVWSLIGAALGTSGTFVAQTLMRNRNPGAQPTKNC